MRFVSIPIKTVNDQDWLILGSRGIFRAARIDKRKSQVADWDGHHCDEALAEGSIRYFPRKWGIVQNPANL